MAFLIDPDILERVRRIELPWNRYGLDPYGVSQQHVARIMTIAQFLYRRYFRVTVRGIANVPVRGRVMLVGNHSGGVAVDGAMVIASMFFDMEPPRLAQGMVEKFINAFPVMSLWSGRTGHLTGLPEHAERLLNDDRMLLVFPEGARGTAKLYWERNSLVDFGTGFVRLALKTKTPIVPFGFVGAGEAIPTIMNAYRLGKLMGVPYLPVTPYLVPLPLPAPLEIRYGPPLHLPGNGNEEDDVIEAQVAQVKAEVARLIALPPEPTPLFLSAGRTSRSVP